MNYLSFTLRPLLLLCVLCGYKDPLDNPRMKIVVFAKYIFKN